MNSDPIVATRHGQVRGVRADGVEVFRGLRYGAPAGGRNRFRAPQPVEPWDGVLDARACGPQCPQSDMLTEAAVSELRDILGAADGAQESGEDCLRLNVCTPASGDGGRRAVMVWIHGGYYSSGSGSSPLYDGTALAKAGDVVVVSVTHRLNLFGYLHLAGSDVEDFGQSANVGQLDLAAALEWVRDNIAAFGGDPGCVTIFGESGGGRKCAVLMAMPAARGLFHRAILESGPGVTVAEPGYARALADALLAEVGITRGEAARLQAVPWETLVAAHAKVARAPAALARQRGHLLPGFSPVLDGTVIPAHPFSPAAPAMSADIPVLLGTNRDEHALFLLFDPTIRPQSFGAEQLLRRVTAQAGERAASLIAAYQAQAQEASPLDLFTAIETDRGYWINSVRIAERKAEQAAPVYMYRFDWPTPVLEGRLKACHGLEIGFAFDNLAKSRGLVGDAPEAAGIARRMSRAWIAFAKTGDPAHAEIPPWPPYDPARRRTMLIDLDWRVEEDPRAWARALWTPSDA
jgi:para-nitrobenzyl esterase